MPHDISENQRRLMRAIEHGAVEAPATTRKLGAVRGTEGTQLTADIARKALDRLEKRGFVGGEGRGLDRRWFVTDAGRAAMQDTGEEARDWTRPYVVLERIELDEEVAYVEVATVSARNTEHAYRLAAAESNEPRATTMVAVATRNFQPESVTIGSSLAVVVGL